MSASKSKSSFGPLIPVEFFLVHAVLTELHPLSGEICCALAAAHSGRPEGLKGLKTLHVGCGYGCDVRSAVLCGAKALGVDASIEQIKLARLIVRHLEDFMVLSKRIQENPVVSCIYPKDAVENVIFFLAKERRLMKEMNGAEIFPGGSYVQCDVLDNDSRRWLEEVPSDVVIGNISLHWLVKQVGVKGALERMASTLKPGGVAVFSVPYHFVEGKDKVADERVRKQCVYDSGAYRAFHDVLLRGLRRLPANIVGPDSWRKIDMMLIRDEECEAGSNEMEFVQSCTRFIAPIKTDSINVLRGLGLYEAVMYTQMPAVKIAPVVARAIEEAKHEILASMETGGTFVRFYVFRKK